MVSNTPIHITSVDDVLQLALPDTSDYKVIKTTDLIEALRMARRGGYIPHSIQQIHGTRHKAQIILVRENSRPASLISNDIGLNANRIGYLLALPTEIAQSIQYAPPTPLEVTIEMAVGRGYKPGEIVQTYRSSSDGHIRLYKDGNESARIVITNAGPIIVDKDFLIAHLDLAR